MTVREELQRYLDGELGLESLPAELREEAHAWDAMLIEVRSAGSAAAPVGLETLVSQGLAPPPRESVLRRAARWLLAPRQIRLSPGLALAATAALVVLALGIPRSAPEVPTGAAVQTAAPAPPAESTLYVQFLLEAPDATSVELAGDFTDWVPGVRLSDADGDGVWSVRVPIRPGVHEYMFRVDGTRWVTDPGANWYEDDGYGNRNAVLAIGNPTQAGL